MEIILKQDVDRLGSKHDTVTVKSGYARNFLIPQGMAYALLATLPPQYGLYSAILPIIMYALFGTSRQLAIGPVAIISLLIAEAIEPPHVIDGIAQTNEQMVQYKVELATVIAFFVGVFSLVLGLVRAGQLSTFLSHSVLVGFVSGASVVIALSQLKHVLGFTTPKSHYPIVSAYHYLAMLPQTNVTTLSIGLVGIVFLLGARHVKKRFGKPVKGGGVMANRARKALGFICSLAALEAVIAGTLITTYLYDAHGHQPSTVPIVGAVPAGLVRMRAARQHANGQVLAVAVAALVRIVNRLQGVGKGQQIRRGGEVNVSYARMRKIDLE